MTRLVHCSIRYPLSTEGWAMELHDMLRCRGITAALQPANLAQPALVCSPVRIKSQGMGEAPAAVTLPVTPAGAAPRWSELAALLELAHAQPASAETRAQAQQLDTATQDALARIADAERRRDVPALVRLAATRTLSWTSAPRLACAAADALVALAEPVRARAVLGQAALDFPDALRPRQDLLVLDALALLARGDYRSAVAVTHDLPPGLPDPVRLRQLRGRALRQKGDLDGALAVLDALVQAGYRDADTVRALADAWFDRYVRSQAMTHLRQARDRYRQGVELEPDCPAVLVSAAVAELLLDERTQAHALAERAVELLGQRAGPLEFDDEADRATACLLLGRVADAAQCYAQAVRLAPHAVAQHSAAWRRARQVLTALDASAEAWTAVANAFPRLGPLLETAHEVRLAVVLFGGVSLAIYINGVTQELFNLVRATAPVADGSGEGVALNAAGDLLPSTQKIYRRLSQLIGTSPAQLSATSDPDAPLRVRFTIDLLSGTSAGGINALFLAKALANDQPITALKRLWLDEADIAKLLNDRGGAGATDETQALLDGKHLYRQLLAALEAMDGAADEPRQVACAEQLDLYVTATDLHGLVLPLPVADHAAFEKRHRQVFHFRYASAAATGTSHNDFVADNHPFLAFAARCTSAFPFAFEPMKLADIDALVPTVIRSDPQRAAALRSSNPRWRAFYDDYLDPLTAHTPAATPFAQRPFADGGYLDNKPFSSVLDTLPTRHAGVPVTRKLFYVEPAPERLSADAPLTAIDVVQNVVKALVTLPGYETIRADLERVRSRNEQSEAVLHLLDQVDVDVRDRQAAVEAATYGSYIRLKVAAVVDDAAAMAAAVAGFRVNSPAAQGVRELLRALVRRHYVESTSAGEARPTLHELLVDFDVAYRLRRLEFVLAKAAMLARLDEQARRLLAASGLDAAWPTDEQMPAFRHALADVRPVFQVVHQDLLCLIQSLRTRSEGVVHSAALRDLHEQVAGLTALQARLEAIARAGTDAARAAQADACVEELAPLLHRVARQLAVVLREPLTAAEQRCALALAPAAGDGLAGTVRACLWHYYRHFEDYDCVAFPLLWQTGLGELARVDVHRLSPADVADPRGPDKLAGTAYANFGGFFSEAWRRNDLLWGRLHTAERLLQIFLPDPADPRRAELLRDARDIIIHEELGARGDTDLATLLLESLANAAAGRLGPPAVAALRQQVQASPLRELRLDPAALRTHVLETMAVDRTLEPRVVVETLARCTQIVGKMLHFLADKYRVEHRPALWLTRLGRWGWGFVELAMPGSLPNLLLRRPLHLLYLFELLLLVGGVIFVNSPVQHLGLVSLASTLALHGFACFIGDQLGRRRTR